MDRLETVSRAAHPVWTGGATAPAAVAATSEAAAPATTTAAKGAPAAFAAELEKAKHDLRKGESLKLVEGHAFARIRGGTRHDMCVNVSGNERSGDAFDLITRNGRTFHVYGDGKDKIVVEVKPKAARDDDAPAATTPATPAAVGGTRAPARS